LAESAATAPVRAYYSEFWTRMGNAHFAPTQRQEVETEKQQRKEQRQANCLPEIVGFFGIYQKTACRRMYCVQWYPFICFFLKRNNQFDLLKIG
jgi:hypothetical protein